MGPRVQDGALQESERARDWVLSRPLLPPRGPQEGASPLTPDLSPRRPAVDV